MLFLIFLSVIQAQFLFQYPLQNSPFTEEDCVVFPDYQVCFGNEMIPALYVEPVQTVYISECQSQAPWHLQRISHEKWPIPLPQYPYDTQRFPKQVYVVDSGIDVHHPEFEGRAWEGVSFVDGPLNPHGTHVAGLIGSRSFGVSKRVEMVDVRVLNTQGVGTTALLVKGLSWLARQYPPAIASISIGGPYSLMVNQAIDQLSKLGWIVVVAAGNNYADACLYSPASALSAITVGAFDKRMNFATFSNFGKCVDVLAPGVDIESTYPDHESAIMSGTSMATPIVSGVIAQLGKLNRSMTLEKLKLIFSKTRIMNLPNKETVDKQILLLPRQEICPHSRLSFLLENK